MSDGITTCAHCGEPFVFPGDSPILMPHIAEAGPAMWRGYHEECRARMVFGSLGHLQGKCSCFGGALEDPPEMTKRQAAQAAMAFARERGKRLLQ